MNDGTTPEQKLAALEALLALYREKRSVDGHNGREWHAMRHKAADAAIEKAEAALAAAAKPARVVNAAALSIRVEEAGFTRRALSAFEFRQLITLEHVASFSAREMRDWPNFGSKTLDEVRVVLRRHGLALAGEDAEADRC